MLIIILSICLIFAGMVSGRLMNGKGIIIRMSFILICISCSVFAPHPTTIAFTIGLIFQSILRWFYKAKHQYDKPVSNEKVIILADHQR
jgi:hypothetical protein